jgi:hypothetical protein
MAVMPLLIARMYSLEQVTDAMESTALSIAEVEKTLVELRGKNIDLFAPFIKDTTAVLVDLHTNMGHLRTRMGEFINGGNILIYNKNQHSVGRGRVKGTVTCSGCGRQGHNRRGCPQNKVVPAPVEQEQPGVLIAKEITKPPEMDLDRLMELVEVAESTRIEVAEQKIEVAEQKIEGGVSKKRKRSKNEAFWAEATFHVDVRKLA